MKTKSHPLMSRENSYTGSLLLLHNCPDDKIRYTTSAVFNQRKKELERSAKNGITA